MKKLYIILTITMSLFIVTPVKAQNLTIESNNAILYNMTDNTVLFEKNKDQKVSIASLTKLMTALVAVEKIDDLNKKVKLEKSDYDKLAAQDASASSLKRNKEYTYMDLLYGLLLESGADCANALSRLTYGNEKAFVGAMNETAKEIGMYDTKFANPIGLDDKNNYSTVEDVSKLLKEDLRNPTLKQIITSLKHKLTDGTTIHHTIYDYMDKFDVKMPYMQGGKTGYEINSGYALASLANKNGVTLLLVTSKADKIPGHIKDAKKVYDYYFNNYDYIPLIKTGDTVVTIKTKYLNKDKINIKATENIESYIEKNYKKDDVKIEYQGINTITMDNKYGDQIGHINVYYKNKLIKTAPVLLSEEPKPNPIIIAAAAISYLAIIIITIIIIKRIKNPKLVN